MFGKNPISKPRLPDDGFQVHSMFYTIQGEGPWAGRPTIFVRFSGCNLRCFWCDTDFTGGGVMTADKLIELMGVMARDHRCTDFVLTGGEPMLQPLPIMLERAPGDWRFQVETAGTVWPAGLEFCMQDDRLLLVCSPKTGSVHGMIKSNCRHWKYVVGVDELLSPDGLPNFSTQLPGTPQRIYRPEPDYEIAEPNLIYVQGRDDQEAERTRLNIKAAADIAMRHGYMLSVQIHKIAELP